MAAQVPSLPTRVDRLRFVVLVDNSIEWMTKLPPGFKHEVHHQLAHNPPIDPLTGVPILDLENYCCGAHGLSILIETESEGSVHHTLFDTGPDSRSIVRNLDALKLDASSVSRIVLSHWHADHSGGILAFLRHRGAASGEGKQTPPIVVDLHPDRPTARGISTPQNPDVVIARLPPDPPFAEIERLGGTVERHAEPHVVAGGTVYVSGEIPRVTEFEQGLIGAKRWAEEGKKGWVDEPHLYDERYIAVDIFGKGLVIFTACSHAGAVNVVRDAVKRLNRPVHMLLGGLHLAGPEFADRIPRTVDFLAKILRPAPTYVLPMHCSGFNAKVALQTTLGDAVVPAGTGDSYEITGSKVEDERLWVQIVE